MGVTQGELKEAVIGLGGRVQPPGFDVDSGPLVVQGSSFGGRIPAGVAGNVVPLRIDGIAKPEVKFEAVMGALQDQVLVGPPALFSESEAFVKTNGLVEVAAGQYRDCLHAHAEIVAGLVRRRRPGS
jgi:hypothetical protein